MRISDWSSDVCSSDLASRASRETAPSPFRNRPVSRCSIWSGCRAWRPATEGAESYGISRNHLMKIVLQFGTLGYFYFHSISLYAPFEVSLLISFYLEFSSSHLESLVFPTLPFFSSLFFSPFPHS